MVKLAAVVVVQWVSAGGGGCAVFPMGILDNFEKFAK